MLAGWFFSILGEGSEDRVRISFEYLKTLDLLQGWKPDSIFDPNLEAALNRAFLPP
jgi:hypothetical protein